MPRNSKLNISSSPQVIIENLARNRITEIEANRLMEKQWLRAYRTPTLVRFIQDAFAPKGPCR